MLDEDLLRRDVGGFVKSIGAVHEEVFSCATTTSNDEIRAAR
jgi:hypothetical protein